MYIQITTRCNMSCDHCCFNCTTKGKDMSKEVFMKAIECVDGMIILGGGEPTIHPQFWDFLIESLAYQHTTDVWLATNGSNTDISIKLAKLARKGIIGCALSQDEWHDPISDRVIEAFSNIPKIKNNTNDLREIRDVTSNIYNAGRAKENSLFTVGKQYLSCGCDCGIIKPNGDIFMCACADSPKLGSVLDKIINIPSYVYEYGCYQSIPKGELDE